MHRSGHVDSDPESFLKDWNKGSQYSNTKLGNVLFAYEAQRRLGPKGIQVRLHKSRKPRLCCLHASTERLAQCREVQIKSRHMLIAFKLWASSLNCYSTNEMLCVRTCTNPVSLQPINSVKVHHTSQRKCTLHQSASKAINIVVGCEIDKHPNMQIISSCPPGCHCVSLHHNTLPFDS